MPITPVAAGSTPGQNPTLPNTQTGATLSGAGTAGIGNSAAGGIVALQLDVPAKSAVGFNPNLSTSKLIINGIKATENITSAISQCTLERTIEGASTLTITVEDPSRTFLNSKFAYIAAPATPNPSINGTSGSDAGVIGGNGEPYLIVPGATSQQNVLNPTSATGTVTPAVQALEASEADLITNASQVNVAYQPTTCSITDGITSLDFALVEIDKTQDEVTVTFEDILVNELRYAFPVADGTAGLVSATTQTRADFMAWVVNKAIAQLQLFGGNIKVPQLAYPSAAVLSQIYGGSDTVPAGQYTQLVWGGSDLNQSSTNGAGVTEDAWSCLTRLANDAQWRVFSDGTTIWFGPDSWLLSGVLAASFVERASGGNVDDIDVDWDIGTAEATATVYTVTTNGDLLGVAPGRVVALGSMGVASGVWIVSEMTREEINEPDVQVALVQAQPSLSESMISAMDQYGETFTSGVNPSGQSTVTAKATTSTLKNSGASTAAQQAVAAALTQLNVPYKYGTENPGVSFDCSGLTQWAYSQAGVSIPRTTYDLYDDYPAITPAAVGDLLPGDLILEEFGENGNSGPGHVGMYIGGGNVIEAPYTGTVVQMVSFTYFVSGQQYVVIRPAPPPS